MPASNPHVWKRRVRDWSRQWCNASNGYRVRKTPRSPTACKSAGVPRWQALHQTQQAEPSVLVQHGAGGWQVVSHALWRLVISTTGTGPRVPLGLRRQARKRRRFRGSAARDWRCLAGVDLGRPPDVGAPSLYSISSPSRLMRRSRLISYGDSRLADRPPWQTPSEGSRHARNALCPARFPVPYPSPISRFRRFLALDLLRRFHALDDTRSNAGRRSGSCISGRKII